MSEWRIRPSSAARIMACPATVRVSSAAPAWHDEYDDNTTREEGTACHWLAHELALGREHSTGTMAPNGIAVDADMQSAARLWVETLAKWGVPSVALEHPLPATSRIAECGGTPDAFAMEGNTVYIGDLKYGYRVVDVWPNWQLTAYASLVAGYYYVPLDELQFDLTIVQPRRWHKAGYVRRALVSGPDMAQAITQLADAAARAVQPDAQAIPGRHCKHCPGRAHCSALRDTVVDVMPVDTHDLNFYDAERELSYLEDHAELLQAYIGGLRTQIEHGLRNGARSTLWELANTTGALEWAPGSAGDVRALAQLMGVNIDKPADLITPTQARAKLGDDIVNMYARRKQGASQLRRSDPEIWRRIFGKGK